MDKVSEYLSDSTQATLLFNSFVGGAAIVEYCEGHLEALRINDKYLEVLDTTREAYSGYQTHLLSRLDEDNAALLVGIVKQAIATGEEQGCELRSLPIDEGGDDIWISARMRLLAQAGNRYILYLAIENISERIRLAEQLSSLVASVPGGILDFEITDRIRTRFFNDAVTTMFGYSREAYRQAFSEGSLEAVHPDDRRRLHGTLEAMVSGREQVAEVIYRHACADGSWRHVRLTAHVTKRRENVICATGILTDVEQEVMTKRTADAQAAELERQRVSLQALYDSIPCGVMQFSPSGQADGHSRLLSFNDTAWRLFGYQSRSAYIEAVHGKGKLMNIHPEDMAEVERRIETLQHSPAGTKLDLENRIVLPGGGIRWLSTLYQKVRYTNGEEAIQVVFSDITERRQTDLEHVSAALFSLYDEVHEFDIERDTSYMRASSLPNDPRVGQYTSYTETIAKYIGTLPSPKDREAVRQLHASVGRDGDGVKTAEYQRIASDGRLRWASDTIIRLRGSTYIICSRDITEHKEAGTLAAQNEALKALVQERGKEAERSRLVIESTGSLLLDYDPAADRMIFQRRSEEGGIIEEKQEDYLKKKLYRSRVSADDIERVYRTCQELMQTPGRRTIEYRTTAFGGGFASCRANVASAADDSGRVTRLVGVLTKLGNEESALPDGEPRETDGDSIGLAVTTMEKNAAYAYIIDPDTREVLYSNAALNAVIGRSVVGEVCYRAFMDKDAPCENCPVKMWYAAGAAIPVVLVRRGVSAIMQASALLWRGRRAMLIAGTDESCFASDPAAARERFIADEAQQYTRALRPLFDEIFELDFDNDSFSVLYISGKSYAGNRHQMTVAAALARWTGRFESESERQSYLKFMSKTALADAFRTGKDTYIDYTIRMENGAVNRVRSTLLHLSGGRYLCCNSDITERERVAQLHDELLAAKSAAEAESRYRIVVEQTDTAVVELNYETGKVTTSPAYSRYETSRHSQEAMFANNGSRALVHPDDQQLLERFFDEARDGSAHAEAVLRMMMTDGSYRWTRMTGTYLYNERGERTRSIATFTDVDDETRARLELKKVSDRLNRIIESIPVGVVIYELDAERCPIYVSDRACEMFGFTPEEYELRIANRQPLHFSPDSREIPADSRSILLSGKPLVVPRLRAAKKDGTVFWVRAFCSAGSDKDGKPLCYAVISDITGEVEAGHELAWKAEKFRILSESAGMITFDYEPHEDVMRISVPVPGRGVREEKVCGYIKNFSRNGRVPEHEKSRFIEMFMRASGGAMSGTFDFQGNYFGYVRWYRANYASLADDSGQVFRIVGRLDDITDIKDGQRG